MLHVATQWDIDNGEVRYWWLRNISLYETCLCYMKVVESRFNDYNY